MSLNSAWPRRYCPICGGEALRANNPMASSPGLGLLVGGGELPVWLALGAGVAVASFLGTAAGVIVGILVGAAFAAIWVAAAAHLHRKHSICACAKCGHRFSHSEGVSTRHVHVDRPS